MVTTLYDYNLLPGDTFKHVMFPNASQIVDSVVIAQLFGISRRKWYLHYLPPHQPEPGFVVEGIGASSGFIEPMLGDGWYGYSNLVCVNSPGGILYADSTACSFSQGCDTLIDIPISRLDNLNNKFIAYPNPGRDKLIVSSDKPILSFQLTSTDGKLYKWNELQTLYEELSTAHLPSGIYFFEVVLENKKTKRGKWIKMP